jgi:hypothetical protein
MENEISEEVQDAIDMLGAGYQESSVEIEAPRTVIRRTNGRLEKVEQQAFIKLSTSFKTELTNISSDALKVWIFIALSINRETEIAYPGLRTISKSVNLAVNTVQKALKELEKLNLLIVDRESYRFNIYKTPGYVSANKKEPTVSPRDTLNKTVSNEQKTVSNGDKSVSPAVILNQINQSIKPEEESQSPDKFDTIRKQLQQVTGLLPEGENSIKMINEFVELGITEDDIMEGLKWHIANKGNARYLTSLSGAIKTANSIRVQGSAKLKQLDNTRAKLLQGYSVAQ